MRTVFAALAVAAAMGLGAAQAAQDGTGKGAEKGNDLGATPAIQGESWFGTGDQDNNRMGERRTDKQKNAIETKDQGSIGRIPDASKGETGLKGETAGTSASGAAPGKADGSAK